MGPHTPSTVRALNEICALPLPSRLPEAAHVLDGAAKQLEEALLAGPPPAERTQEERVSAAEAKDAVRQLEHRAERVRGPQRDRTLHGTHASGRQDAVEDLRHGDRLAVGDEVGAARAGSIGREVVRRSEVSVDGVVDVGRVDEVGSEPRDGLQAGAAGAGPDAEQGLEFAEYGVERQAGAGAFGSLRRFVQNAWARAARVTWRCQPV